MARCLSPRSFWPALLAALLAMALACEGLRLQEADDAELEATPPSAAWRLTGEREEKQEFLSNYGRKYNYGYGDLRRIDKIYPKEVRPRWPPRSQYENHYLDYTATTLYLNSQLKAVYEDELGHIWGNPHSENPTSMATTRALQDIKERLLRMWGTDSSQYEVIFTRSGTGALQLLGESFPWTSERSAYLYTRANHNSVLGIRASACSASARVGAVEEADFGQWLQEAGSASETTPADGPDPRITGPRVLDAKTGKPGARLEVCGKDDYTPLRAASGHTSSPNQGEGQEESVAYSLFAYPLCENFAGAMYPERWPAAVRALSTPTHKWLTLVDIAATVPHHSINLNQLSPDFAILSFYKIFGHPTGVGALLVRKAVMDLLVPSYWGGGSVFLATSGMLWHLLHRPPSRFETGTPPFLEALAIRHGLDVVDDLGGMPAISNHTWAVAEYLYDRLSSLTHSNGSPLVRVFGKWDWYESGTRSRRRVQGPTVNFDVLQPDGQVYSYKEVALTASAHGIHMRWGCMCNPGICYNSTDVTDQEVRAAADAEVAAHPGGEDWEEGEWEFVDVVRPGPDGKPVTVRRALGSIRASLGWMSRFEDAWALWTFINDTYKDKFYRRGQRLSPMASHTSME